MATKRFIMRLYRAHDMDLLYLYKNPHFNFHKFLYRCLENYFLEDKPFMASLPVGRDDIAEPKLITPINVSIKNDDIIKGLSKIDEGKRNTFIKTLMRSYIAFPNFSYFSSGYNLEKFGFPPGMQIESFINTKKGYTKKTKKKIESFKDVENIQKNAAKSIEKISSTTNLEPEIQAFETIHEQIIDDDKNALNELNDSDINTQNTDNLETEAVDNDDETASGLAAFSNMFNNF